jgi:hypothetical protein
VSVAICFLRQSERLSSPAQWKVMVSGLLPG